MTIELDVLNLNSESGFKLPVKFEGEIEVTLSRRRVNFKLADSDCHWQPHWQAASSVGLEKPVEDRRMSTHTQKFQVCCHWQSLPVRHRDSLRATSVGPKCSKCERSYHTVIAKHISHCERFASYCARVPFIL